MDKVFDLIKKEEERQREQIHLIPSENMQSEAVKRAVGSVLANKYAEGYPGRRYYQGNGIVDEIENLAMERGKKLLGVPYINVQPYSGSPANSAVLMALVEPGDKICGLKLSGGGHLTHGHPNITFSGKYYQSVQYDVEEDGRIDYEKLADLVRVEKPKLIWAGTTAYPYVLEWEKFRKVADLVGAWLVADISHIVGLIVGAIHESPVQWADVITSTTHKSLRGPRGAFIAVTNRGFEKDGELDRKIDRAVFPGMQGGPHINSIAGMAVAFEEASRSEFKEYAKQIVANAKILADSLRDKGFKVYGSENHLMVVEIGNHEEDEKIVGDGKAMAVALEKAGIIVNANTIPHDNAGPFRPSGIRIGTPWETSRGMKEEDMRQIARWIARVRYNWENDKELEKISEEIEKYLSSFT